MGLAQLDLSGVMPKQLPKRGSEKIQILNWLQLSDPGGRRTCNYSLGAACAWPEVCSVKPSQVRWAVAELGIPLREVVSRSFGQDAYLIKRGRAQSRLTSNNSNAQHPRIIKP